MLKSGLAANGGMTSQSGMEEIGSQTHAFASEPGPQIRQIWSPKAIEPLVAINDEKSTKR
jgi:hypothetical protein